MSDEGGLCAVCCIAITTSLQAWCNTKAYSCGCCNAPRGCCGSCFEKGFDDDAFEEAERKAKAEEIMKTNLRSTPLEVQPGPAKEMTAE